MNPAIVIFFKNNKISDKEKSSIYQNNDDTNNFNYFFETDNNKCEQDSKNIVIGETLTKHMIISYPKNQKNIIHNRFILRNKKIGVQ